MRRYGEIILSLQNDYYKQQSNYPRTLTDMYGLMVAFNPTRATPVARGCNKGLNFRNVVADSKTTRYRDNGSGGGIGIKLECWKCVGVHLKRNCPKRAEEKEKKYDGGANNKRAEVKEGQLHAMFTSLMDVQSGIYFSDRLVT